jgi:hypothetical protein
MQLKLTICYTVFTVLLSADTVSILAEFEVLRSSRGGALRFSSSNLIVVELKVTVKTRFNISKGDKKTSS